MRRTLPFVVAMWCFSLFAATHPLDSWTQPVSGISDTLFRVIYTNGIFVAVGGTQLQPSRILTSTNGVTWTQRTAQRTGGANDDALQDIIYADGLFVTVGLSDNIFTSPDAINWTYRTNIPTGGAGYSCGLLGVAHGNGIFVAVGTYGSSVGALFTSTNAVNWQFQPNQVPNCYGVIFANGQFVAIGVNKSKAILISTNGVNWTTNQIAAPTDYFEDIIFVDGRFVLVGGSGFIATSTNATDWVQCVTGTSTHFVNVSFLNGTFLAAGQTSSLFSSDDAVTWKRRNVPPNFSYIWGSAFGNHSFVLCGNGGVLAKSTAVNSAFLTSSKSQDGTSLTMTGEIGQTCRLQGSTDLTNWIDVWSYTNTAMSMQFAETNVTDAQKLYRVVSP